MQRLADDLLVLARSRGGRVPVQRTRISLRDLVARSVGSVRVQAHAAGTPILVDAADETVEVDPDRVEQALRNLLENAIQHSSRGGRVTVVATRDDRMVRIVIGDSGPGFAAGLLATAFEPFTSSASGGERGRGIGLGLAIVRAVAEAHGGSVAAENLTPGARVTLFLRG
jgi:signal transduction histidine kinase